MTRPHQTDLEQADRHKRCLSIWNDVNIDFCNADILERTNGGTGGGGGLGLASCAFRQGLQGWMQQHSNTGWLLLRLFQTLFKNDLFTLQNK